MQFVRLDGRWFTGLSPYNTETNYPAAVHLSIYMKKIFTVCIVFTAIYSTPKAYLSA